MLLKLLGGNAELDRDIRKCTPFGRVYDIHQPVGARFVIARAARAQSIVDAPDGQMKFFSLVPVYGVGVI